MFYKNLTNNQIAFFGGTPNEDWILATENEILNNKLEQAKESKKQALKANRDNALNNSIYSINVEGEGSCDFYLRTSDLAVIQARINNLSNDTSTKSWGCTDGRRVELNKAAFQSLFRHISVNDETVYNLYADKIQEIEDAQTLEELENININFD